MSGRWVPVGPEGLPHHLNKRHPKDRRRLGPDIPDDLVVAVLWVEPLQRGYTPFWLPSVWMNGRFLSSERAYFTERGAKTAAYSQYKAHLPSLPARANKRS